MTIGSIVAKLMLNIDNFSSNLSMIQNEIANTGKKLDGLNNVGNGLSNVGKTLTTAVTLPIVGVGTAAAKLATDFEYSMSQVKAISGATGEDFKALESEAIKLGGSTKYSATTVADAMTEMAKAGWTTEQILSGMSGVLDAAAASGEDLGAVSTIVADAITGFGLAASDSTRVADLLTQAANSGTIGVTDLGESFKYIAPVASSLGFSIEEATTAIAAMSTAGIKGSQAGTSLKNMLTNLIKPTDPMAAVMEKLGISVTNSAGEMKSLDDILANLRSSFEGLTEAEKAKYAATLAGKEGMSGMLALLNIEQNAYDDITASMLNSGGAAKETASVMQDNLASAVEQLGGAMESLAIRIGQQLTPIIRKVAEHITAFTEKLAGASEEQIQMAIKVAAVVAAIGPLIAIVGKAITMFTTIAPVVTTVVQAVMRVKDAFVLAKAGFTALAAEASPLGAALAGISAPVLAVVAAVGVLVAAFVSLWKSNEDFRNKITEIWTGIKDTFSNFFAQITEKINSLGFKFEDFSQVLKALWQGLCDFLAPLFVGVFQFISDTIGTVLNVILGVVSFFTSVLKGDWEGAWNAVKSVFEAVWNGMVAWLTNIGNTLLNVLNVVLGWLGTSWQEVWTGIQTFFVNLWNNIVMWFQGVLTGVVTFFTNIWTGISTFFQTVWTGISTFFTNIITSIVTFVQTYFGNLFVSIQNIFNSVRDFLSNIWEIIKNVFLGALLFVVDLVTGNFEALKSDVINIWENIKTAFFAAWDAIKSIFTNALNVVKSVFSGAMDAIKAVGSNVMNALKTFFANVLNNIKTTFVDRWNAIKTFFSNAVSNIKTNAINTFNSLKEGIATTITNVKETIVSGITQAVDWIKALPGQALEWGRHFVSGFVDGITSAMSSLLDTVKSMADNIRSFLHFTRPDVGPLRDYETWMPDMVEGLSNTLQKAAPQLYKTAGIVASGLTSAFNDNGLQTAMAGAYGSVSSGTLRSSMPVESDVKAVRNANGNNGTINIEKIEVRDDNDIEELTQGLYDHNDKSLRAMGRRNLG